MTDRSNYGPVRRLSPSVSIDNRKPYSRTGLKGVLGTLDLNSGDAAVPTPSDSPYYPFHVETPQLEAPTQNRTSAPDVPRDIPGFPTYDQYQRIEGGVSLVSLGSQATQGAHLPGALRQGSCRPTERRRGAREHRSVPFLGPQDVHPRLPSDVFQPQRRPDT